MEAVCGFCGASSARKRCSQCKTVIYCSKDHQIKHWKLHKLSCRCIDEDKIRVKVQSENEVIKLTNSPLESKQHVFTELVTEGNNACNQSYKEMKKVSSGIPENIDPDSGIDETCKFNPRPFKKQTFLQPENRESEFKLSEFAAERLKQDGYCVIDNVISDEHCEHILGEIEMMNENSLLRPGKLAGGFTSGDDTKKVTNKSIRSDNITWVEGTDDDTKKYPSICELIGETMDIIVAGINTFFDQYVVSGRTKAMVACYPGSGTAYQRHVDNPCGDGRLITCIVYLNKDWNVETQGGLLRIFPSDKEDCVDIEPIMGRMLLFWSDSRNPHEVQPAFAKRYAITTWYYDIAEREKAKEKELENEMAQLKGEVAMTKVKSKTKEKEILEKKIAYESVNAVNLLTEEELEAICTVLGGNTNPRDVLTSLGIATPIQDILLPEIQRRNAQN